MNNKGFNWFFPIAILAVLLYFGSSMYSESSRREISEDKFFQLMQENKVQDVTLYRDTYKGDVFLTQAAKAELVHNAPKQNPNNPFVAMDAAPQADYVLMVAESYHNNGDLDNAISLLNSINPGDALNAVQRGLLTAQGMEYEEGDMRLIADLEAALLHNSPGGAR